MEIIKEQGAGEFSLADRLAALTLDYSEILHLSPLIGCLSPPLYRYLLAGVCLFMAGLLIGRLTRSPADGPSLPPMDSTDLLEDLLEGITADRIKTLQR